VAEKSKIAREESRRMRERIALSLPVRVYCRETLNHEWTEMSRLVDVTPFGARLRLKHPTEIGRLLLLTMAMPRQLRCFDHVETQYRVWSLVRNVRLLDQKKEQGAMIEIGVAFVGKRPPKSFEQDPTRRYDIGKPASGLWTLQEESETALAEIDNTDKRKETRHTIPIEVVIEVVSDQEAVAEREGTVTENISHHGAAVFTALKVEPGRFVKFTSTRDGTEMLAAVRARTIGSDGITRLHLEFVGCEWAF
jgi:hypothetical protein